MEKKHPLKLHASRVFSIADPNTYSYKILCFLFLCFTYAFQLYYCIFSIHVFFFNHMFQRTNRKSLGESLCNLVTKWNKINVK